MLEYVLTSAQQQLWMRAQEAMEEHDYDDALFLAQSLLRVVPEFLEARMLARQAAIMRLQRAELSIFEKIKRAVQIFFATKRIALLLKKKQLEQMKKAFLLLEKNLEKAPQHLFLNRLMAALAQHWRPALLPLAIFSLETALALDRKNSELSLEMATVALLPDQTGMAWNPERAMAAYQQILAQQPHHLEALQGMKNASAFLSMKNDFSKK